MADIKPTPAEIAARTAIAKKIVEAPDPAMNKSMPIQKPQVTKESIVNKVLSPKPVVKQGTQPDHAVTNNTNHTATVQPTKSIDKAETILKQQTASNKVKDVTATKQTIAKKTGVWPNGATN